MTDTLDISKWCEENEFKKCTNLFKSKEVTMEELVQFEDNSLKELITSCGYETKDVNRFLKLVTQLRPRKRTKLSKRNSVSYNGPQRFESVKLTFSEQRTGM